MKYFLKVLSQHQLPNGQFPTKVINYKEGFTQDIHTITPTYLICLMLSIFREHYSSHHLIDRILEKGMLFFQKIAYQDPIEKIKVWHFNAYYPPDWENTCWCSYLLYQAGIFHKKNLEPLYQLILANETPDKGVGVWVKDTYSEDNRFNNVFDPLVSVSVVQWLERVFGHTSEPTKKFILACIESDSQSLYYDEIFKNFLFSLFGYKKRPNLLTNHDYCLFHHGKRTQVWYASSDAWETANIF